MTANIILVVEHIPRTLAMLCQVLEAEGHTVLAAHDAQEALAQMAKQVAKAGRQVDLIIQDLSVPDMEPAELTWRLRACPGGAEVPILASSGFLGGQSGAEALGAGFSALLVKPFEEARVVEVVNVHLPARATSDGQPGRGRPLLLVDDDPVQLKLVAFQLRRAGFEITVAASGHEALAAARARLPAVIVSDVLMPGMDGFQLCLEAGRDPALARVPVVLLSAQYLEQSDRDLAAKVGASRLIPRVPRAEELIRAVVQALDEKVIRRPAAAVEVLREEHFHRVIRQLERQTALAAGMAQTSAIQAAQLSVLGGVANALAQRSDVETVLRDVLPGCFDPAGISKAVIYLADPASGELAVRHAFGFAAEDEAALANAFGCLPVLRQVMETGLACRFSVASDPGGAGRALLDGIQLAAAFVVPLGPARSRIGTLLAGTPVVPSESSDPSAFVRALGGQIGHALTLSSTFAELGNAVAARDEFIAVAAHELRTPLTALNLSLQGLARAAGVDVRHSAASSGHETKVTRALRQMARLTWLVENLLDVSRIGRRPEMALQRESVDLREIVREVAEQLRDSVGDPALITVDAPEGVVGSWDRFRLRTVVSNLITNAFKFSAAKPVDLSLRAGAGLARLTVTDHGIGIRPEDRERIFQRFEQAASRNYGGLGIGLWITRQTVEAHGGRIWVDSEVGKGSVFTVELPLTEGPPATLDLAP